MLIGLNTREISRPVRGLMMLFVLITGFFLAENKPLWNDEIYSQNNILDETSLADLLLGRFEEGNNTPLFYLLQKGILTIVGYSTNLAWKGGAVFWHQSRSWDRIALRIQPVVCMTALIVMPVFFFTRRWGAVWGGLALVFILATPKVWQYWAEARPYALWMMLTMAQMLMIVRCAEEDDSYRSFWLLAGMHCLLALTTVLSAGQIFWGGFLGAMLCRQGWRGFLILVLGPGLLILYYLSQAPRFAFWVPLGLDQYLRAGFLRERLYLLDGVLLWAFVSWVGRLFGNDRWGWRPTRSSWAVLIFCVGMLVYASAVYALFQWRGTTAGVGFSVTDRYFVQLAPVGSLGGVILTRTLWTESRWPRYGQWMLAVFLFLLLARQVREAVPVIAGFYPFLWGGGA